MTESELVDFLTLRSLPQPVTPKERESASERSRAALDTVRDGGAPIEWIESQILTDEDDRVTGTLCHFRAESEDVLYDHADCAGLPVTDVHRRGDPVDGPDGSTPS
jgi:hypothetical protein